MIRVPSRFQIYERCRIPDRHPKPPGRFRHGGPMFSFHTG